MKYAFAIFLMALTFCAHFSAYAVDKFTIQGIVYDRATDTQLLGATARLLNASDSAILAETIAEGEFDGPIKGQFVRKPIFFFFDVDRSKNYILELTRDNYEPAHMEIDPSTLSNRLDNMNLGKLYMKRMPKTLNEVVVKASKVMFYNKGDTVVYNADAFVLAEGSMLDALIRQMPGVELKDGGEIYVNGRYVENLLLNGKDFFKGNRQMMLNNLGAYTVKDIAVYERQDEMDKLMGDDYGEKRLSMDVRLKKEYNQGLLVNAEAGYGSSDRHLGRLFGLWYSDNARLSLYGNANNLSDNRKPGQNTDFTPGSMQSGDFKTYQGGFDYWAKIPYKNVQFYGDAFITRQTADDYRSVNTTNFLPGGDTYEYSFASSRNKSLSLSTSHSLEIQNPKWNLKINPNFKYSKNNDYSSLSSAAFSEEQGNINKDFIDKLYEGASAEVLASILNRNTDENKNLGHSMDAAVFANGKVKMPNDADAVTYLVSGNYARRHFDRYQRYVLNFGGDPTPADFADRHFDNTPNYKWTGRGAIGYIWAIMPGMYLDAWYQFDHATLQESSKLYQIENAHDDAANGQAFGWLPSRSEYEYAFDPRNSFNSRKEDNIHSLNFNWKWNVNSKLSVATNIPLTYKNRHLHYVRGSVNTSFSRNETLLGDAAVNISYYGRPHFIYFDYKRKTSSPDLVDMVDFTDDLDPLNVRLGNPNLKESESHSFSLRYRKDSDKYQTYSAYATILRNALAYGYEYDSSTGVKTGRMHNVNGNCMMGLSQYFSVGFGHLDRFNFSNSTAIEYRRSVDLIGEDAVAPSKNKVYNAMLSEAVDLSYKFGNSQVSILGEARVSGFDSKQKNFKDFTACDFKYGINGNFALPAGFGISTDFTIYSRKGYSDNALNKTNFVWNAQARYTILSGQLTFMVDGFDILHSLSNVFYSVNAQARTETYTNVLPRYVMFHLQWKFHKAPKKK
ncbi:MAG: outer membrane beta-barrel family protein [Clostridium sp.]|nr:outer membrane beta-barrel family protein [Clostridium sp.]